VNAADLRYELILSLRHNTHQDIKMEEVQESTYTNYCATFPLVNNNETRLATADSSRISIHVKSNWLGQGKGVFDTVKLSPPLV